MKKEKKASSLRDEGLLKIYFSKKKKWYNSFVMSKINKIFTIVFTILFLFAGQIFAADNFQIKTYSDKGSYVGQGENWNFNNNNAIIKWPKADSNYVGFKVDDYSFNFQDKVKGLVVGLHSNAKRHPFYDISLDIDGDGRGNNELSGLFYIHEYEYQNNKIKKLSIDFVQLGETDYKDIYNKNKSKIVGSIRINSNVALKSRNDILRELNFPESVINAKVSINNISVSEDDDFDGSVRLKANVADVDIVKYKVFYKKNKNIDCDFNNLESNSIDTNNKINKYFPSLKSDTDYYFKICAIDKFGNSVESDTDHLKTRAKKEENPLDFVSENSKMYINDSEAKDFFANFMTSNESARDSYIKKYWFKESKVILHYRVNVLIFSIDEFNKISEKISQVKKEKSSYTVDTAWKMYNPRIERADDNNPIITFDAKGDRGDTQVNILFARDWTDNDKIKVFGWEQFIWKINSYSKIACENSGNGYIWDDKNQSCECKSGFLKKDGKCVANDLDTGIENLQRVLRQAGFVKDENNNSDNNSEVNNNQNQKEDVFVQNNNSEKFWKNGKYITHTEDCQSFFHDNHMIGTPGTVKGTSACSCESGYLLNKTGNGCVAVRITSTPSEENNSNYSVDNSSNQKLGQGQRCSVDLILHQNLRAPRYEERWIRNGRYDEYTKTTVREAHILQKHLNRLDFSAGPVDGIIGPKTRAAILRLQRYLGTKADGYVGPKTRALLNNSCGI